jgi:hypothetical protein
MEQLSNIEFLTALFGDEAPWTHVTDFTYDPDHIPENRHLAAWCGDYFDRHQFKQNSNQYFTISHFFCDDEGKARRRKSLYRFTAVIVLDDVREKLPVDQVQKLPEPTWILETSPGSEQWGYLLAERCEDRQRVENLIDGLVANGLAPDGKDPGMKGVTRYVRLPEGYNTKAKKMVNGKPFKVRTVAWNPFNRVTLEDLAAPFNVNLDAVRREARTGGATTIDDHPLINVPDLIHIKEVRSNGGFDITCPWVDEHTRHIDNGTAIFTNTDGSIGFKCHHGSCQHRTGRDLLDFLDNESPGFKQTFDRWKISYAFRAPANHSTGSSPPPLAQAGVANVRRPPTAQPAAPAQSTHDVFQEQLNKLKLSPPFSTQSRELASTLLKVTDNEPAIERQHWQDAVREHMQWSKNEFKNILRDLRESWYSKRSDGVDFFNDVIFVAEQNQFYDRQKHIFYSPEAYQNTYAHLAPEARKDALQGGMVMKVDKLDYAPLQPSVFQSGGIWYGNTWSEGTEVAGAPGDIRPYLKHFETLKWLPHRDHVLQWMAYTLRYPDKKINHMIILGSGEGAGKDWLLTPLVRALGNNSLTINGEELLSDFNEYCLGTKHLHINEVELGDHNNARMVANRIKPLAAAPPFKLRVNSKGVKRVNVTNLLSVSMTTNSRVPVSITSASRRIYALWTDFSPRDEDGQMLPQWLKYWEKQWEWMNNGGAEAVIHYLRHEVDLSQFNPGAPPPVTDFLKEIRASSETTVQQTLRAFVDGKHGAFAADLAHITDIVKTLKHGEVIAPSCCFLRDMTIFTPGKTTQLMHELGYTKVTCKDYNTTVVLWVLRNRVRYDEMRPVDIVREYERQVAEIIDNNKKRGTLRAVK